MICLYRLNTRQTNKSISTNNRLIVYISVESRIYVLITGNSRFTGKCQVEIVYATNKDKNK